MKKLIAAIAIAAAMPVATAVTAPAALAQAEGGFEIPTPP